MKNNSDYHNFEAKYKEQLQTDTPDLWSRIEEGIVASENKHDEHDVNYFNQTPTKTLPNKAYAKKMLSLAAGLFIVVAAGILISSSVIFQNTMKSMSDIQPEDDKFSSSDGLLSNDTNINVSNDKAMQSGQTNIIADSELSDCPDNSEANEMAPSEPDTCQIQILQIKSGTDVDVETSWTITAEMLMEDANKEPTTITILVSDSIIDTLEIGKIYEVILEPSDSDYYYLKSIIE